MGKGRDSKKGRGEAPKAYRIARIARSRKDGDEIKFTDYKGEKRKGKYAPAATVFARNLDDKRGPMMSIKFEDGFEINSDEEFYNFYLQDGVSFEFDMDELGTSGGKPSRGKSKRRDDDEDEEESDEDSDDEDGEDPFA
jgi:hypothetical protein